MEKHQTRSISQNPIRCSTARSRAIALVLLSLVSLLLAVALGYLAYLIKGPTTLGTWYNPYWIGFFFLCGLVASAFFVFRHTIRKTPERLFLVLLLSITCFSALAFDMNMTSWDPGVHYRRTLEWTQPDLTVELSAADARIIYTQYNTINFGLDEMSAFSDELNQKDAQTYGSSVSSSYAALYNRIVYFPGALVLALLNLLGISFSTKFLVVRLMNAIVYSLIVALGMKQLKSGKMLYAVIAMLPTALLLASNYGQDHWINAFLLLGGACLVRELQTPDKKITWQRVLLLLGAFVIGFGPKAIYAPLILLCLLVPRSKFASRASSIAFRIGVIALCVLVGLSFLGPYLFTLSGDAGGGGDSRGGEEVNAAMQISFILTNPIEYARILLKFLFTEYFSPVNSRDFTNLYGYLGTSSRLFWVWTLVLMAFTTITDKGEADKLVGTWKSRTLAILLFLATSVLIVTALYIEFTAVGLDTVVGVQGRYLIPLLFCTLVFLSSPRLALPRTFDKRKTAYNTVVLGSMSFIYLAGLWQVYLGLLY